MAVDEKKIEEAITFLVDKINSSGTNPKPVIFHSVRVGVLLFKLGYSELIVIAGILHDLIEDSSTKKEEIGKKFGKEVAELVAAVSFDKKMKDRKLQFEDTMAKIKKVGRKAFIIKAADFIDNSAYYHLAQTEELFNWLNYKIKSFAETAGDYLDGEPIWPLLKENINDKKRKVN